MVEGAGAVAVIGIAHPRKCALQRDRGHVEGTAVGCWPAFIHILNTTGMIVGMRGVEVDLQVVDRLHDSTYLDISAGCDAGRRHHTVAPQQPVVTHRLINIAVVNHTEGEVQSRRQDTTATRLSQHVSDVGHETRQQHRVLLAETDIDGAHGHQQAGDGLGGLIPPLVLRGGLRHDTEFDLDRIKILDNDLVLIDHLVADGIGLTVLRAGCDGELLRSLVVGYGNSRIGLQGNLALVGVLVLGKDFLFRVTVTGLTRWDSLTGWTGLTRLAGFPRTAGTTRFLESLVGLLQEGEVVIEHLEVQRTVDVQITVACNGVSKTGTVIELRTACPGIAGIIRGITIHPVEDGQFVQWQLVAGRDLLLIVERGAQMTDTVHHRVLPRRIPIGIEVFVHGGIRLLDLRTGSRLEIEVEVTREVPAQGEVAVPEELLVEHQLQVLVLQTLKVAFLQFVIAAGHLGIKRNALRQVIDTDGLGEVQPLRLTLQILERLPGLIDG